MSDDKFSTTRADPVVQANLKKLKAMTRPGNVSKYTPTPWDVGGSGRTAYSDGTWVADFDPELAGPAESEITPNAKLACDSVNSYAKHCKDPVAAAESDLLGRLLNAVERIRACAIDSSKKASFRTLLIRNTVDALLAETKEGP